MIHRHIEDWDNAYANTVNIAQGNAWPNCWMEQSIKFRTTMTERGQAQFDLSYGKEPRQTFDLFLPENTAQGLFVFVHGGYWMALDKTYLSHLAQGALMHDYAVAMPSYSLCPQISIGGIVDEIGMAIEAAAERINGPIVLSGHSAGGQLVSRMITTTSPVSAGTRKRIKNVISISGLHDLRPLLRTSMNEQLKLDEVQALQESAALLSPIENARITCWVGGTERAEFLRQSALLSNVWTGLGAYTALVVEPDRHHYNVVDGLADPNHPLTRALIGHD